MSGVGNGTGPGATNGSAPATPTPVVVPAQAETAVQAHIPVCTWLGFLGLTEYEELFRGFAGVEVRFRRA